MTSNIKSQGKLRLITLTGLLAAIIYIVTAFVHIPTGLGYTHPGDGIIYLAASILPAPYAVAASAIGGALADGLSGFVIWMPATIVIKAVTALFFSAKTDKIICARNILAVIPSLILCVAGYSLYEGIVMAQNISFAAIAAAFGQTPFYCLQVALSTAVYILLGAALDKINIRRMV
ncbi:TIGR04002 family protein [Ruminococcus sp. Marseille-P6503]|uniref:TIGR04002 family protein n=1 Tax=Ruminococcus sp. Marseille-P6503 TaxID=2364796 RepID=UPI000F523AD0|nr:TIGR04002 family protein [Ruminococcus sp. Marseille-P6503]